MVIPDEGYLAGCVRSPAAAGCLFIADEIQSGLGRTGRTLAVDHEGVVPDVVLLGTGARRRHRAGVRRWWRAGTSSACLRPGEHGSTFGGNPLAAVGSAGGGPARDGRGFQRRAAELGRGAAGRLARSSARASSASAPAGCGPASSVDPAIGTGREISERLMQEGILRQGHHGSHDPPGPPLTITDAEAAVGPGDAGEGCWRPDTRRRPGRYPPPGRRARYGPRAPCRVRPPGAPISRLRRPGRFPDSERMTLTVRPAASTTCRPVRELLNAVDLARSGGRRPTRTPSSPICGVPGSTSRGTRGSGSTGTAGSCLRTAVGRGRRKADRRRPVHASRTRTRRAGGCWS